MTYKAIQKKVKTKECTYMPKRMGCAQGRKNSKK